MHCTITVCASEEHTKVLFLEGKEQKPFAGFTITRLLKFFLALKYLSSIPSLVSSDDFREANSDLLEENAGICTFLTMFYKF